MIPRMYYVAVKKLSSLNNGDFYCLNCLHSFRTKNKIEPHQKLCANITFFIIVMPSGDTKTSEFNENQKSDRTPFII